MSQKSLKSQQNVEENSKYQEEGEENQNQEQDQQEEEEQNQKGSSNSLQSKRKSQENLDNNKARNKSPNYYQNSLKESQVGTSPTRKPNDKTFITLQKKEEESQVWKPFDFLFPAGRLAKLVKVFDVYYKNFPFSDLLNKLKLTDGYPVVNLIGASQANRGKFYAGLARACFNSEAIVVDSAIETGLEQYAIRRDLTLIGVAPENCVKYPKINPTYKDPMEISNGHTHLFLINDKDKTLQWSQETLFKIQLVLKLAEGKVSKKNPRCKIVNVLLGDTPNYLDEVRLAVKYDLPIIVCKGSPICDEIIKNSQPAQEGQEKPEQSWNLVDEEMQELLQKGHFYMLNSIDSEDIAQYIHFLLTFTPY